jgi:predicted RNase H-like nuclease (RuvC/YqgF family)
MRKDSISDKAIEQAYLIYSERGHQILDYSHTPTDYARGTVMEPENTSVINSRFGELLPENIRDGGEYDSISEQENSLNQRIDSLQNEMRTSRMRGNFKGLQAQMKEMHDLIKAKEALDAKLATLDLGRKQMDDYDRTMDQDDSYSEQIQSVGSRIAELEAKLQEYRESTK